MTPRQSPPATQTRRSARAAGLTMLGSAHPFVRAAASFRSVEQQAAAVAAVLAIGAGARIAHVTWSWPLICAAGIVLVGLLIIRAAVRQRVRDEAINLLLTGYETAPIAAVQNQRRRLVSRRTRRALGRTYTTIARQAGPGAGLVVPSARPLFQRRIVRGVIDELVAIGQALERDDVAAPAVARAERLITDGTSNLYGSDQRSLKQELQRILKQLKDE
jgi:hypothetical protein